MTMVFSPVCKINQGRGSASHRFQIHVDPFVYDFVFYTPYLKPFLYAELNTFCLFVLFLASILSGVLIMKKRLGQLQQLEFTDMNLLVMNKNGRHMVF